MRDEDARICGVCGRVLEQWVSGDERHYRHGPADDPADHPPVAVRAEDARGQVLFRCDFCFAEPTTHTLVLDRELSLPEIRTTWDKEWAMCSACTALVVAGDWVGLRRRCFAEFEALYGPLGEETRMQFRIVHRDLRAAVVMIYQDGE